MNKKITLICLLALLVSCKNEPQFDTIAYYNESEMTFPKILLVVDTSKNVTMTQFYDTTYTIKATLCDSVFNVIFGLDLNKITSGKPIDVTDGGSYMISFVKGKKIVKTINSNSINPYSIIKLFYELTKANDTSIFTNPKDITNENNILRSKSFVEFINSKNNNVIIVPYSEMYLLLNYLYNGTIKDTTINNPEYTLNGRFSKIEHNNRLQEIKQIGTDGRYYVFEFEDGTFKTIDIGVNFLSHTLQNNFGWRLKKRAVQ